jgi:hypothetical protein
LLSLRFFAAIVLGDDETAVESELAARSRAYGVGSSEILAELSYYEALYIWSKGDLADARVKALRNVQAADEIPAWLRDSAESYPFSQRYWKARSLELLGAIAALDGLCSAQARYLVDAFAEYDASQSSDIYVEASMLRNLAVLVRDIQSAELEKFVRIRLAKLPSNESTDPFRFHTIQALGWCSAMSGDHLGGLREFRQSSELAPNKALKVAAILDRCFLATELGESFFSAEQLEYASELSAQVDWERSDEDNRVVLLELARVVSLRDSATARALLDRYQGIKSRVGPLMMFSQDRRKRGYECMAIAAVVRAEGQLDRATMLFKEAFEIWSSVGYEWRAASAALEIYTLTGEEFYLDVVAREAATRPQSWIARRYAAIALGDRRELVLA